MRLFSAIFAGVILAVAAACSSSSTNSGAQPSNVTDQANSTAQTAPAQPAGALSPTETLRALSEASNRHDPEAIKRYLSEGTIKLLEQSADKQNKKVDEILREEDGPPFLELPEIGKEAVNGDTATVEIKSKEMEEFDELPLVREDGSWKVAIDQYVKNLNLGMDDDESSAANTKPDTEKKNNSKKANKPK